jgi:hypothetical protein
MLNDTGTDPAFAPDSILARNNRRISRSRMSTFQHSELLPEHEILQNKIPAATEKANQSSVPEEKPTEHGKEL